MLTTLSNFNSHESTLLHIRHDSLALEGTACALHSSFTNPIIPGFNPTGGCIFVMDYIGFFCRTRSSRYFQANQSVKPKPD
ncbi:hypothetical protein DL95DRAFT_392208 [Leptodontidium sp. 2 PMI_412]|nr:hypothetical protein DL95DRAFT_392208 [Leptodontidium sp. 2 PMI_412]